jgi:hypothetical protein
MLQRMHELAKARLVCSEEKICRGNVPPCIHEIFTAEAGVLGVLTY